jgi:hypothetical protein
MVEELVGPDKTNRRNKRRHSKPSSLTLVMVGFETTHPDQHRSENLSLLTLVVEELVGPAILT